MNHAKGTPYRASPTRPAPNCNNCDLSPSICANMHITHNSSTINKISSAL